MDDEQLKQFIVSPYDYGGTQLMMPGKTYQAQLEFVSEKWNTPQE